MAKFLLALLVGLAVGAGGGGYVGYGLAERDYLKRATTAIEAALRAAELAVNSANAAAADEQRRAVADAIMRSQRTKLVSEVIANAKPDPDRADCEWNADERLRLERLYSFYGFTVTTDSGGMHDAVQ